MSDYLIPRRCRVYLFTPAERAISDAVQVVEAAGAHRRLTDAVILLGQAREAVADFVDGIEVATPPAAPSDGLCAPCLSDAPCPRHSLAAAQGEPVACPECGDGSPGYTVTQDAHGEPEQQQCRECFEREKVASLYGFAVWCDKQSALLTDPRNKDRASFLLACAAEVRSYVPSRLVPLYAAPVRVTEAIPKLDATYGAKVSKHEDDEGRVCVRAWYPTWTEANVVFRLLATSPVEPVRVTEGATDRRKSGDRRKPGIPAALLIALGRKETASDSPPVALSRTLLTPAAPVRVTEAVARLLSTLESEALALDAMLPEGGDQPRRARVYGFVEGVAMLRDAIAASKGVGE